MPTFITTAVEEWLAKPRLKIAKVLSRDVQQAVQLQDAGVQVDTRSEESERVWMVAEALDQEVDFLEQELECAEALLKLPPEKEDSISENSDSKLSDQDDLKGHCHAILASFTMPKYVPGSMETQK